MKRRTFLSSILALPAAAGGLGAQGQPQSMTGPMDQSAHRPVRLPPKENATSLLTAEDVKKVEQGLKCQCTCPLDVYTCRTTDFSCPVSPAMHRDVMLLVQGGYNAEEIVNAFVDVYGERARMAPKPEGFNLVGYFAPYVATGTAALLVGLWIMKSLRRQREMDEVPAIAPELNATPEEVEQINRALRGEGN